MSSSKSPNKSIVKKIEEIFTRLAKVNPNPRCELFYLTPYQLVVSVVLSAQTTDKKVNQVMTPIYKAGFTEEQMLALGEQVFFEKIKTIGLAKSKAKYIFNLTQILITKFHKTIPQTHEALTSLPGVGTKTANVVLAELYNHPTLAVDTHVFRVSNRLGLQNEPTPEKAEKILLKIIPKKFLPKAHHWLILHGRYVCKARGPLCHECTLQDLCPYVRFGDLCKD